MNDKEYIDHELETLGTYITLTQTDIEDLYSNNKSHDSQLKYLPVLRVNSPKQLADRIKSILSGNNTEKIPQLTQTSLGNISCMCRKNETESKSPTGNAQANNTKDNYICDICNTNFKTSKLFNAHVREDDARSVFYRLVAIMPKQFPNAGCLAFWGNISDLKKHMGRRCHLGKEEKPNLQN